MTNKCYAYSTLKVKDILHWRTSRPQEFPFPGISEVQIQPKSGLVWSYFDDDYDDYGDYDDYDDYEDYDDCDGNYDVLNLTQLLMQNSHCLLLSSFIPLPKNGNEIFHSPSQKFSFLFPFSKSKSHSCSPLLGRRLSTLNNI